MKRLSAKELEDLMNQAIEQKEDVKKAAASFVQRAYTLMEKEANAIMSDIRAAKSVLAALYNERQREIEFAQKIARILDGAFGEMQNQTFTDPVAREAFNLYKRFREAGATDESARKMVYGYLNTKRPADPPHDADDIKPVIDMESVSKENDEIKINAGLLSPLHRALSNDSNRRPI